jgi:hypothetical protein
MFEFVDGTDASRELTQLAITGDTDIGGCIIIVALEDAPPAPVTILLLNRSIGVVTDIGLSVAIAGDTEINTIGAHIFLFLPPAGVCERVSIGAGVACFELDDDELERLVLTTAARVVMPAAATELYGIIQGGTGGGVGEMVLLLSIGGGLDNELSALV